MKRRVSDGDWLAGHDPRVQRLEAENARLEKLLGLVRGYSAAAGTAAPWTGKRSKSLLRATACLQLSDLHLDERVDPHQVGSLNAYSREIAEQRLKRWASKACDMGHRLKHRFEGAIVFLGGDFVSGSIHEELRETNEDNLPGSMIHWAPRIASALGQVLEYYGRLHVPAIVGNHGRLTKKMPAKNRGKDSWDRLLYELIRGHFANDDRVTWDISEGSYLFVPLYGKRHAFFTHGDEVHGGGGWAGVWSPLGTIARRGLEIAKAHELRMSYAVVGHWHQTVLAHERGLVCNGAMKGWDEFAASLRFAPERAMQNWWVETPEHGVTIKAPLFLDDRAKEGW